MGKAGRKRWLGIKPTVRGVANEPCRSSTWWRRRKTSGGRHPVTPWGKLTKGTKTRSVKKANPLIIQKENNMNRSKWKGPFVDQYLVKKLNVLIV